MWNDFISNKEDNIWEDYISNMLPENWLINSDNSYVLLSSGDSVNSGIWLRVSYLLIVLTIRPYPSSIPWVLHTGFCKYHGAYSHYIAHFGKYLH